MHCVILAGGIVGPDDPLYAYTGGRPKALLDMGGRPMLERVIAALQASSHVEEVLVVGIAEETIAAAGLQTARPVAALPDAGDMLANMLVGAAWFRKHHPEVEVVLGCSADIPTITGRIVDAFIEACRPWDKAVYYNLVTRQKLEARFPHSRRTYSRYGPIEAAGGDMAIARLDVLDKNRDLAAALSNARKQPWRIAGLVGVRFLVRFLLHRVTVADVEKTAERIIGAPVKIILDGSPELAMDADKPFQVDLLRAEFAPDR
jgi:molybdopterin-guanine dinucleotide biosynthesis protein A